jgi:lipid-binding SYLF domain-containing protein
MRYSPTPRAYWSAPRFEKPAQVSAPSVVKCVLTSGADEPLYYQATALKAGAILGVSSHSMILVINTDKALANFTSGKREWEFGLDASVAVAKIGVGGDLDTTNLKRDIVSFIFGERD